MNGNLRRRLYSLSFIDEFGPVYAVYTLWFNDHGISTSQVSTLFLVWALISLSLEIPSGALADRVDRRRLIASAFAIRACGIAIWLVWPTVTGVFIGAALWATHDALASGSWEALIYEELANVGAADRYGPVMARIGQFSNLGVASGTVVGALLLQVDVGVVYLGWLTVAAHAGSIALVMSLPDVRAEPVTQESGGVDDSAWRDWLTTMRQGLREARHTAVLTRLIGIGALLEGLFLIDEYIPLLTRARGGADDVAPLIVLVVWIALLLGDEMAARRPALPGYALGLALIAGMAVTALAFVGEAVWALALIAIGYAVMETVWITTDARLQERTNDSTRATVTSVRGFGSACVSMAMFAVIGFLADGDNPTPGLLAMVAVIAGVGVLITRWLPPAMTTAAISDREPRTPAS